MSSKTNPKKIKEIEKEKEKEKEDENTIVLWLENLKKEMKANEPDDFQDAALMLIKILQNKVHDIPLNIFMKKYNFKKLIYCDSCKLLRATDLIKKLLVDLCPDIKQETNFTHQKICPSLIKEPEKENYRNSSQLSITPVTKETERKKKKEILKEQFKEKSPIGKSLSQPSVKRKLELIQSEDIGKNLKLKPNMESNLFNEKRKSKNKAYFALKNKAEEKDEEETDLSELSSTEESEVNPILTLNDSDDIVVVNKEEEKMKKMIIEVLQQEIEKKEKEKKLKKEKKKEKKKMVQKDLVQKKMVQKDLVQKDLVQKEIVQKVEQKKIDKKMEKKEMEQKEDQKEREEKKELVVTKDLEEERQKKLKELMTNKYLLKQEMMNNVNKKEQIIETLDIKKEKNCPLCKAINSKKVNNCIQCNYCSTYFCFECSEKFDSSSETFTHIGLNNHH